MLIVKLNGMDVELVKGEYANGRFAVTIIEPDTKDQLSTLTVNIPEVMFYGETIGEGKSYEALVNHIDGFDYSDVLDWIDYNNLIETNAIVGEIKSGFNFYIGVKFKKEIVQQMRTI